MNKRKRLLTKLIEEVKENIDEAVEVVDEVVVNNPVVVPQFEAKQPEKKTAPDLSDIVDLLPPGMLAAVNQQTGQKNYEKTPRRVKTKVESISNAKILKTMTASLEKIQGQLSSIDNELKQRRTTGCCCWYYSQ